MPIKNGPNRPWPRIIGNIVLLLSSAYLLVNIFFPQLFAPSAPKVPYSLFIHQVKDGEVMRVSVGQDEIRYQLADGSSEPGAIYATTPILDLDLPKLLEENGVEFAAKPPATGNWFTSLLGWVIPPLIFVGVWQLFLGRRMGGPQGALSITKNKARVYVEGDDNKVKFDDVAGVEEAKTELVEVVEFLKDAKRFTRLGARIPKGVLLIGPPGTGKTLLAKAVAGEAGVPFFSISGSEFVELFVGAGAARVRDLFEQAKKQAPCIIFIDELDAIGTKRFGGDQSGDREVQRTMLELLSQLDGFNSNDMIKVIAATNRPDVLDPALLRSGRLDRKIELPHPTEDARAKIMRIHSRKMNVSPEVVFEELARSCEDFNGAQLKAVCVEAGMLALRMERSEIVHEDFIEAISVVAAKKKGSLDYFA